MHSQVNLNIQPYLTDNRLFLYTYIQPYAVFTLGSVLSIVE